MSRICANVKAEDLSKIPGIKKTLRQLGVETGTLSTVELSAVVTRLATTMNITPDLIMKASYKGLLADAIASERNRKIQEDNELAQSTDGKVGQATLILGKRVDKADPRNHKDTLYIYPENAQAHNVFAEDADKIELEGIITPTEGVTTDVTRTDALMRVDTNGSKNPNTTGIVVKMNAQNKEGKWIQEEGVFPDTDEAFAAFNKTNGAIIDKIAQAVGIGTENVQYSNVSLPKTFALDNAGLPKRFAESLARMFKEKLGLDSQVLLSKVGTDLYGIEIQPKESIKQSRKSQKATKSKGTKKSLKEVAKEEALKSLEAERPAEEMPILNPESKKLLMKLFPDIAERKARVNYISTMFSERLSFYVNNIKSSLSQIPDENLEDAELKVKRILNSGTESEQRVAVLGVRDDKGNSVAQRIIQDIKGSFEIFVNKYDQGESAIQELVDDVLLNKDTLFGFEFSIESHQNGWRGIELDEIAHKRVAHLAAAFRKIVNTPGAFEALLTAAADELEFTENINLAPNLDLIETAADVENVDEEGSAEDRSGLNLIKYKLIDPAKTLSMRIKNLLSRQYKVQYSTSEGTRYVFDDLGQRVRVDSGVVYYKLLDIFCKMNKPEDFERFLDKATVDYPWFDGIRQMLKENQDLRNEFYRAFRKVFILYSVITSSGNLQFKNSTLGATALIDMVSRNYEGRMVLGANSLYTETGECNAVNVARLRKLIEAPSKEHRKIEDESYLKYHPFHWIHTVLSRNTKKKGVYTVKNIRTALNLLRGELEGHTKISLEHVLNNIGIDTTNMNLEALMPYIDDATWEEIENSEIPLDALEEHFTPDQMKNIKTIIEVVGTITHPEYGFKKGGHLLNDFRTSYEKLGNILAVASDGYSLSSFYHEGKQRYSYAAPDFISSLVGIISSTETEEDINYATQYIEDNFLRFNLFRNPTTGEIMSPWLEDFITNPVIRKNFAYTNVLAIGNKSNNSIGKVSDSDFLDGLISVFFLGNKEQGMEFGYYRNPLFADNDSLVLFKQRKFTGEGAKDEILNRLVKVFRQELERITAARNKKSGIAVDNFNDGKRDNAEKFCFFTNFRGREDEIIDAITELERESQDAIGFIGARDNYIKETLLAPMLEKKVSLFKNSISPARKEALFSKILKNIENSKKGTEDIEDAEGAENVTVDLNESSDSNKSQEWKEEQVDKWLEEFYYNDYFAQSQLIQLLFGDLAYAKDVRDFVKRNKQSYASGEKMYSKDENNNPLTEKSIYLEDREVVSNSWAHIKALLESSPLASIDKSIIRGALESFKKINETDGQSFRSIKSLRKILKAMGGKWTDGMERAYKRLLSGEFGAEDFLALWNPMKPFLFSYETREINGRLEKITVQHKNSEYLITALYSVLNTALNKSPELRALQAFMDEYDVDVVHFKSVVKLGFSSPFTLEYNKKAFEQAVSGNKGNFNVDGYNFTATTYHSYIDKLNTALFNGTIGQEEYNKAIKAFRYKNSEDALNALREQATKKVTRQSTDLDALSPTYGETSEIEEEVVNEDMFHTFPLEDYIVVQPSDDHLVDHVAVFGSQLRNIMPADLPSDFTMAVKIGDSTVTLNRDQTVQYYNTLIVDQLLDAFSSIEENFDNIKSVKAMLDAAMENNSRYGDDVKAALELNEDGTAFKIPFNNPNLTNKIEDLFLSVFKNHIQRQKINGGNVVLVSNFGLSDQLHVKYKNDDPTQGVEYIPAYMPANMRDMYSDYLEEVQEERPNGEIVTYWTINFDKLKENNEEDLLNIIGYRIPTEDKYSIMPIKIVGFMPIIAGGTIMLPSDIITMSGTDFDIDKLFLMIRNIRREIAGAELASAFEEWAEKNHRRLDTVLSADHAKFGKFLEEDRQEGFTWEEIKALEDVEVFQDFMEDVGYDLLYENPKYVIQRPPIEYGEKGEIDLDATSRMESIKSRKVRKAMRDNLLIDTIWNILTSPAGSRLSMTPASYKNLKKASRQQRILHNPAALSLFMEVYKQAIDSKDLLTLINGLDIKALEDFYENNAAPDDPLDIGFYVDTHRNLMDGNDLIGMFAVNSSGHYKFQFADLSIHKDYQFKITLPGQETKTVTAIDLERSPFTGRSIGRECAEYQAASPDNGKDPVLGDIGANTATTPRIGFLGRIGLDATTVGILNTADDLREYGKQLKGTGISGTSWQQSFDGNIARILKLNVELRLKGRLESIEDQRYAAMFAQWMDNIDMLSDCLQQANSFARCDSPNGAVDTTVAGAIQQLIKVLDFMQRASSPKFPIQGLADIIDISLNPISNRESLRSSILEKPIPRLQAFYTLSFGSAFGLCSRYLVQTDDNVMLAVQLLREQIKDQTTQTLSYKQGLKTLKTFINELTTYALSADSLFSGDTDGMSIMEKRNYYIHDFPMKFRSFLEQRDEKGNYLHKDLRDLTLIQMLSNNSQAGIKFRNVGGKISTTSRKYFMEDLEYILTHPDPEVQKLAIDLFKYSYYDNGLNFGHSNFGIFFTTAFMEAMPKYISKLTQVNGRIRSDANFLGNYVNQFLLNHPNLLVSVKTGEYLVSPKDKDLITINNSQTAAYIKDGRTEAVEYIAVKSRISGEVYAVYKLVRDDLGHIDPENLQYRKVEFNRMQSKFGTPYYDANIPASEIEWENLQERGYVVGTESLKEATGKSSKPKSKSSEDSKPTKGDIASALEEDSLEADAPISEISTSLDEDKRAEALDKVDEHVIDEDKMAEERDANMLRIAERLGELEEKVKNLEEFKDTEDIDNRLCIPE